MLLTFFLYFFFLLTHADCQGVDILVTVFHCVFFFVCLFVCTVTGFSAEDNASGIKFCTAFLRRPSIGFSRFRELCIPISPKSAGESASACTEL